MSCSNIRSLSFCLCPSFGVLLSRLEYCSRSVWGNSSSPTPASSSCLFHVIKFYFSRRRLLLAVFLDVPMSPPLFPALPPPRPVGPCRILSIGVTRTSPFIFRDDGCYVVCRRVLDQPPRRAPIRSKGEKRCCMPGSGLDRSPEGTCGSYR